MKYQLRGYPVTWSDGHYIAGAILDGARTGGGILEWCVCRQDAEDILQEMKKDRRFQNLSIGYMTEVRSLT